MKKEDAIQKEDAIRDIRKILEAIDKFTSEDEAHLRTLCQGKLYELYVLSQLLRSLSSRGFSLKRSDTTIEFKQAPGKLLFSDPHFLVTPPSGKALHLFVDVEFETLGHSISGSQTQDRSSYHELDLMVVEDATDESNPRFSQILLAVECKSGEFEKSFIREALGLRRELSYWKPVARRSRLSELSPKRFVRVPVHRPRSEFWLAFADAKGMKYRKSPAEFGVYLVHCEP